MLPMLNESVAVLREGIVADADLLDAGVIFGTGFAPFPRRTDSLCARARARTTSSRDCEALAAAHGKHSCTRRRLADAALTWSQRHEACKHGSLRHERPLCYHRRRPASAGGQPDPCALRIIMESKPLETSLLRSFSPLDGLKQENLHALARKARLRDLAAGPPALQGRRHRQAHVLTSSAASSSCCRTIAVVATIRGGTPEARNPLAPDDAAPLQRARRLRARSSIITIDSDLLDVMLTWDQTGSYEVSELGDGEAWRHPTTG